MKKKIVLCLLLIVFTLSTVAIVVACDDSYTVEFYAMDGKTPIGEPQTVKAGESFVPETAPAVEGYTFIGWVLAGDLYDLDASGAMIVEKNLVFVAEYSKDACTVTFRDGDKLLGTASVKSGERIPASQVPETTKLGYRFIGWSRQGESDIYSLNRKTTGDVDLVARYERIGWVVTFTDDDGSTILSQVVAKDGETVYYTGGIVEKTVDGNRYELVSFGEILPATEDVTYTAVWRKVEENNESGGDSYEVDPF